MAIKSSFWIIHGAIMFIDMPSCDVVLNWEAHLTRELQLPNRIIPVV